MTKQGKQEMEAFRKEAAITNLYFNRYLIVRYTIAFFLFINVYWATALYTASSARYLIIIPLALIGGFAWSMWEMALMNRREQEPARVTRHVFQANLFVTAVVALVALLGQHTLLFPFLTTTMKSLVVVLIMETVGFLLSLAILSRLRRIDHKADKQYQRIQTYLKSTT